MRLTLIAQRPQFRILARPGRIGRPLRSLADLAGRSSGSDRAEAQLTMKKKSGGGGVFGNSLELAKFVPAPYILAISSTCGFVHRIFRINNIDTING